MRYIADALTFGRIAVSAVVIAVALMALMADRPMQYVAVAIIGSVAFLTDALDGIAARRWPHSAEENAKLWYRKDPHLFDNVADVLLYTSLALSLATRDTMWLWLFFGAMAVAAILFISIELLFRGGSIWAEKIDVMFGWLFGLTLSAMIVFLIILASPEHWMWFVGVGLIVGVALVPSKWDRLTTRPERHV